MSAPPSSVDGQDVCNTEANTGPNNGSFSTDFCIPLNSQDLTMNLTVSRYFSR